LRLANNCFAYSILAKFFELTADEMSAYTDLLAQERLAADDEFKPDGYNVGVNVNKAGGQNIFHIHTHLFPRFAGDSAKPRGGVRQVIPEKADYVRT
jgi:diadenosine tetraphosphate (Ap4A) HIT family hydrolase